MTFRFATVKAWLLALGLCAFPAFVSAEAAVAGEAKYIPSRDLGATLIAEIGKAQRSVSVYLYLFALYPNRISSQTMQIAEALASAKSRGAAVEVVLDGGAFSNGRPVEAMQEDNREAYEYLRARGVEVFFDDTSATLHAKAIVIDSLTVMAGSANLSEAALGRNAEASLLVRNRETALALLADLGRLPRKRLAPSDSIAALAPVSFLTDTALLGRMVNRGDQRSFDVYLFLCKEVLAVRQTAITLDYARLAASLGISSMPANDYRRQINKTLDKLQHVYRLAHVTTPWGKDAKVVLNDTAGPFVAIPAGYWDYGWQKRLRFAGKVMAILGLHYSGLSPIRPRWSMAAATLASRHGMSVWFVQTGTAELKRANLLDVEYGELPEKPDNSRQPNSYTPLPFYDPLQLEAKWQELNNRFGREMTDRARACVALVYKDSDWRAVEQFIELEQRYGRKKIEQAASIIKQKSPDNPRRTVGYFIRTVENLK